MLLSFRCVRQSSSHTERKTHRQEEDFSEKRGESPNIQRGNDILPPPERTQCKLPTNFPKSNKHRASFSFQLELKGFVFLQESLPLMTSYRIELTKSLEMQYLLSPQRLSN